MSDLQVLPLALPGGINQGNPAPTEADLEELSNFVPYKGRLALRGPLSLVETVQDDQVSPADVSAILDIITHDGQLWITSWSSSQQDVYLHSMDFDGTNLTLESVLWSSVASKPTVVMASFEGGTAEAGVKRIYISDYHQVLTTRVWNGSTSSNLTVDFNNNSSAEQVKFSIVMPYKYHMWGTGFYEDGAGLRPEMLRFSQPGLVPCDDPAGGSNPKEWASADHRSVGARGDKIRALGRVGDRLIVLQRRMTHALFGSGVNTWTRQELSPVVGAVGPFAVASADNRILYFWALGGPYRTDGSEVQYIGDPIQDIITEVDASELDTRVTYSPDSGLVHFIVSAVGDDDYKLALTFDHRAGRWMKETWLVGTSTGLEIGAAHASDHPDLGTCLYFGERSGARIFRAARAGYDDDGEDLGSHVYQGVFRTERIAPAGPSGLINFRRLGIHLLSSGTYTMTVKCWIDGARTTLGTGATQTVTLTSALASTNEYTEEVAIQGVGNHIQVEITVDSDDITSPFLIESIMAYGRVIRGSTGRNAETS